MAELPAVTLYGKPDCHLCDEAEDRLVKLSRQVGLSYKKVDIQTSTDLFARFRYSIPVIEIAGGATLDWPITSEELWSAIRAAARP